MVHRGLETMACGRFLPVLARWPGVRPKGDTPNFITRLIYLIFRAVEWAQWFLKQGDAHLFRAIGIVIIVFGSAMLGVQSRSVMVHHRS
jgi:hypothetical protein